VKKIFFYVTLLLIGIDHIMAQESTSTPEEMILQTLNEIRADLIEIKASYPQLSKIESTAITENPPDYIFSYEMGFIADSKMDGPVFKKHGADILVRITYPADEEETTQLASSYFLELRNGKSMECWILVQAEQTTNGRKFCEVSERLINEKIEQLLVKLKEQY
jgi:hypothetical protein